ncbi:hypothetical protein EV175_005594 [Coemansia sp. RSA 1933]|nr:hypothetical protein EV175_005594 [Coemansia sp. RSA 1933]
MDEFIGTVKSQDIPLDGFDKFISVMYIPRYHWFENKHQDESFMPPQILCSSFYRALQDFPVIAGCYKTGKDGQGTVIVDRGNLNMPIYTDSDWDVDFKQIKDAGFNTGLLPETFDNARGLTSASRFGTKSAKLGIFHVRRLKHHSGVVIFASIAHGIVDGYGHFAFMKRWAEISKLMHESPTENVPERVFSHDRSIHNDYRQEGTSSLDDMLVKLTSEGSNVITSENKPDDTLLTIPMDFRPRTNHPDGNDFVGNFLFARYILFPQELAQADPDSEHVSAVATKVREAISATDKTYIGQLNHLINSEPDMSIRMNINFIKYKSVLSVTNFSRLGYYELDFGGGIPRMVHFAPNSLLNIVEVMRCHPDIGGYKVTMSLAAGITKLVSQNERWMKLVDSYHLDV